MGARREGPIRVAAALIEKQGKILICRRAPGDSHPGKWEFPGGKIEAGETPREALKRELREELGIEARVGNLVARTIHQYPGRRRVELWFFKVDSYTGEAVNKAFGEMRWEEPRKLTDYDFLEADEPLVRRLATTGLPEDRRVR